MPFQPTSRYYLVDTDVYVTPDGENIRYLLRRFVPQPERFTLIQDHTVTQGERLDNITASYLGDPEQFWQLCDSNRALRPEELTEKVGRQIHITLPEGIPGASNVR